MILFCLGTWGMLAGGIGYRLEIFLGMIAPLTIGMISMAILFHQHQNHSTKLTSVLIKLFITKLIIYGVYFYWLFTFYTFTPIPFVISFTGYFVTLHIGEALFLKSIFKY